MNDDDQAAAEAFQAELEQRQREDKANELLELLSYEYRDNDSWAEWYWQIHEPAQYEAG